MCFSEEQRMLTLSPPFPDNSVNVSLYTLINTYTKTYLPTRIDNKIVRVILLDYVNTYYRDSI
jgi:hypothetical protein